MDKFILKFQEKVKQDSLKKLYRDEAEAFLKYLKDNNLEMNLEALKEYLKSFPSEDDSRIVIKFYLLAADNFLESQKTDGAAASTLKTYESDLLSFYDFLIQEDLKIELRTFSLYKEYLEENFKTATAGRKLIIAKKYYEFHNEGEKPKVQPTAIQRNLKEFMTLNDYERVMKQVLKAGDSRTAMIMETLVKTGLRFSELQFVTVEALKEKVLTVKMKGTQRSVPLVASLVKDLKKYIKDNNIKDGMIFTVMLKSKPGFQKLVDHAGFFKKLKRYAGLARVKKDRVSPHALRHLFAKEYLQKEGNHVMDLGDLLGHKSLETTRIYTKKSAAELRKTLEK